MKLTQANKPDSNPLKKEPGENMDFDFEQGLLDVWISLMLKLILMIFLIGKVTSPRK